MAEEYKLQPVLIKSGDCKIIIYPGLVPFIRYVVKAFRSILWYVNGTILSSLTNLSRSFVSRYQDARYSLWENIADVSMASSWIRKDWLIYRRWGSNYFTCPAQFLSNSLRPTYKALLGSLPNEKKKDSRRPALYLAPRFHGHFIIENLGSLLYS